MQAETPEARAAATRVVRRSTRPVSRCRREIVPSRSRPAPAGSHRSGPRSQLLPDGRSDGKAVLAAVDTQPDDKYVNYTGEAALGANLGVWQAAYVSGELAEADSAAAKLLESVIASIRSAAQAVPHLQVVLGKDPKSEEERNKAMTALADLRAAMPTTANWFSDAVASLATRSTAKVPTSAPT
jgi:hypothetical protein